MKILLAAATAVLALSLALMWKGTHGDARHATLEVSLVEPVQAGSRQDQVVPLVPIDSAPSAASTEVQRSAASPDLLRGSFTVEWAGETLRWKHLTLHFPQEQRVVALEPTDTWEATADLARTAELFVDDFAGAAPHYVQGQWHSSLLSGAELRVVEARSSRPIEGHELKLFVREMPLPSKESTSTTHPWILPATGRSLPLTVTAPGYVAKTVQIQRDASSTEVRLEPAREVLFQVQTGHRGQQSSSRLVIRQVSPPGTLLEHHPLLSGGQTMEVGLPMGRFEAFLEVQESPPLWSVCDRSTFTVSTDAPTPPVQLSDEVPLARIHGTVTVEPDGKVHWMKLELSEEGRGTVKLRDLRVVSPQVGKWSMSGLFPGSYELRLTPGDLKQAFVLEPGKVHDPIHFDARGGRSFEVEVVDANIGGPIHARSWVSVDGSPLEEASKGIFRGISYSDRITVQVQVAGRPPWTQEVHLSSSGPNRIVARLKPSLVCRFRVRVRPRGAPQGAEVPARYQPMLTVNASGHETHIMPGDKIARFFHEIRGSIAKDGPATITLNAKGFQQASGMLNLSPDAEATVDLELVPVADR